MYTADTEFKSSMSVSPKHMNMSVYIHVSLSKTRRYDSPTTKEVNQAREVSSVYKDN